MSALRFFCLLCVILLYQNTVWASHDDAVAQPTLSYGQARTVDGHLQLDLAFHVPALPPFYSEALLQGIPLYIRIDCQLQRVDWHLFTHQLADKSVEWKLSYHQLTEKYRLTQGTLYRVFSSLPAVLDVVSHLWSWSLYDHLDTRSRYLVRVRWSVDNTRLPLIFQVGHFATDQWTFDSDWIRLPIIGGVAHWGVLPDTGDKRAIPKREAPLLPVSPPLPAVPVHPVQSVATDAAPVSSVAIPAMIATDCQGLLLPEVPVRGLSVSGASFFVQHPVSFSQDTYC